MTRNIPKPTFIQPKTTEICNFRIYFFPLSLKISVKEIHVPHPKMPNQKLTHSQPSSVKGLIPGICLREQRCFFSFALFWEKWAAEPLFFPISPLPFSKTQNHFDSMAGALHRLSLPHFSSLIGHLNMLRLITGHGKLPHTPSFAISSSASSLLLLSPLLTS